MTLADAQQRRLLVRLRQAGKQPVTFAELRAGGIRATAFLMPIRWPEPFGMVIVEALACGTPVITFPEGAASEIVIDGENGFHVPDEQAMADAVGLLETIDPLRCRESVASRYDAAIVADGYEAVYRDVIQATGSRTGRFARPGRAQYRRDVQADLNLAIRRPTTLQHTG
jgi:glycosyltransferase involved in cell wall biosynthesis